MRLGVEGSGLRIWNFRAFESQGVGITSTRGELRKIETLNLNEHGCYRASDF